MFKVGDEVWVKGEIMNAHEGVERPYFVAPNPHSINWVSEDKIFPADKTYVDGLTDAWELVRKLGEIEQDEREKMFSYRSVKAIIEDCTIEEVMDKIEAYEKEKEIKVGDVVRVGNNGFDGIVTLIKDGNAFVLYDDGSCGEWKLDKLIKTGKHIEGIESLLRQIGE